LSSGFFVLNIGVVIGITFGLLYYFVARRNFFQQRAETLLLNILPKEISELLKADHRTIADQYNSAREPCQARRTWRLLARRYKRDHAGVEPELQRAHGDEPR
jgi:hypothetical protein